MIPSQLTMTDFAGQTRTVGLDALTLIAAPNGKGKTTVLEALHLCLTARFPGQDKIPSLDDARERGPKWDLEFLDSAGGVVTWSFSGSQLVPGITVPGRSQIKGKDAVIAAIIERYGAVPTLHARDLERLTPDSLARWIVSLCARTTAEGSSLTPAACERVLVAKGATGLPALGSEGILSYLDRCAAAVETQAGDSRSRKRTAETAQVRKAVPPVPPVPGEKESAEAALDEAKRRNAAAVERLGAAKSEAKTARDRWEQETADRRKRFAELSDNLRKQEDRASTLRRDLAQMGLIQIPEDPGPEPANPDGSGELVTLRAQLADMHEKTVRAEVAATAATERLAACASGTCPTCGEAFDPAKRERMESAAQEARQSFIEAGREHDTLRMRVDTLAAEVQRYEVASRKWAKATTERQGAIDRNAATESRRSGIEQQAAEAEASIASIKAEIAAMGEASEPQPIDLSGIEVEIGTLDTAVSRAQAVLDDILGRERSRAAHDSALAEVDRAIESERATQERLKGIASAVDSLRSQATGQAVGPFVAAVNGYLHDAKTADGRSFGVLAVDLSPTPRVGFVRGEAFVPVSRLSGMELATWLAAAAIAAAALGNAPCQCVLIDDVDRLTETPRAAVLRMLADASETGEIGACVCALAWESPELPAAEGWRVVGL